jgi:hypothetical protein
MGLGGTPMPGVGDALAATDLWALVYDVDALAPPQTPTDEKRPVGEEPSGSMVERMHGMMGRMPMMERMMRRQPQ